MQLLQPRPLSSPTPPPNEGSAERLAQNVVREAEATADNTRLKVRLDQVERELVERQQAVGLTAPRPSKPPSNRDDDDSSSTY
jgi:hypothetical protein